MSKKQRKIKFEPVIKLKPQHLHVHSEHVEVQFYLDLNSALGSDVPCKCTFNWRFKIQRGMKHSYAYKSLHALTS